MVSMPRGRDQVRLISAIIPARNEEASIARAVESVAAQAEIVEVIVVNDGSTDRTRAVLDELATRVPKLRIIETEGLPAGWVGKNHALAMGAAEATGDWLLFTDADTYHYPGSARRALVDAVEQNAVLVSYSPEQELGSFWERALVPFIYCRLARKFSFTRVNDPAQPDAAANGQFLMMLREVYQRIGGHAAVAGEVLEDVALARQVKQGGYQLYFTAPIGTVRTRMYRSLGAMWEGWTKNLYTLMGGNLAALLSELSPAAALVAYAFLAYWLARKAPALLVLIVGFLALLHVVYAAELYKNLFPLSLIKWFVPGVCLYTAVLVGSWWKSTWGTVVWKGREYRARV
jgi:glycosyltransferase involved in cell wall biosynthesis